MRSLLCCAFITAAPLAHTQDLPIAVAEPLVVTATRVPMAREEALQSVTVLSREDWASGGTAQALTILQGQTGFESAQNGGLGAFGSIFLRGTDADQTLVLIDGIRLNSPTDGGAPLNHLMLDAVDRIELVRGNVSSLYGSQAIGGVVQLFTRAPDAVPGASIALGAGSLRSGKARVELDAGGDAGPRFTLGASYRETAGFSAVRAREIPSLLTRAEDRDDDAYRNATFNARMTHSWRAGHELAVSALHTQARTEFDGSLENRTQARLALIALNSVDTLSERWTSRLTLGQVRNVALNFLDRSDTSRFETQNQQLTWQNEFQLTKAQSLLAGIEWLRQTVDSTTAYEAENRRVTSPFLGYYAKFGKLSAQLSARRDDYSDVQAANTGRVSLGYELTPKWRLRAGVATAFKAPSFDDLYFPGFSNPNLKPERARSIEAGMRYVHDIGHIDIQVFSNRLKELITFDSALLKPVNVERAKIEGIELTWVQQLGALQLTANATWQDPKNETTGERLLRRAELHGAMGVSAPLRHGTVGVRIRASGGRTDNSFDFTRRVRLGSYAVADLEGEYALSPATRLSLSVENLFDKDYELAHGYNVAPRTFFVQLSHRFQ